MTLRWPLALGALLWASACTDGPSATGSGGAASTSGAGGSGPDPSCEVIALLQTKCWACHDTTPLGPSTPALVTYKELTAPSAVDPRKSYAERAVLRMQAAANPMPPFGKVIATADEIAAMQAWINGGYRRSSCGEAAKDPFAAQSRCSSGAPLDPNQQESPQMNPGHACNTCHEAQNAGMGADAPIFTFVGTVFPTAHEPDDCLAPSTKGATVEVTDANGKVFKADVNAAGNFFYEDEMPTFASPYTAKVVFQGRERWMATPQKSGECNGCHTPSGDSEAPGRILLP